MTDLSREIAVKPVIKYPREAQVGKTYLMTIDLQPAEGFEWRYEEEEYPIYCKVDSDLFSSKPVGEPTIVLHRFGGTYGEARFLLETIQKGENGEIRVVLTNRWGMPIKKLHLKGVKALEPETESLQQKPVLFQTQSKNIKTTTPSDQSNKEKYLEPRTKTLQSKTVLFQSQSKNIKIIAPRERLPNKGEYLDYRGIATQKELEKLYSGILPLGKYLHPRGRRGRFLGLNSSILQQNLVVVAPTGSGKTRLAHSWGLSLLQEGNSVVLLDWKGEFSQIAARESQRLGYRFWYWDTNNPSRSQSWNWLQEIQTSRDIAIAVYTILETNKPNDPYPQFKQRDAAWLQAIITLVKRAYGDQAKPKDLYNLLINRQGISSLLDQLNQISNRDSSLYQMLSLPSEVYHEAVLGILNKLSSFDSPVIEKLTSRSDFHLSDIDSQPTLLLIASSLTEPYKKASILLLNQVFNYVYTSRTLKPQRPLFFILDEFPRIKDSVEIEDMLSVARSTVTGFLLMMQDIQQLGDARDIDQIMSKFQNSLLIGNCSSATVDYFSKKFGTYQENRKGSGNFDAHFETELLNFDQRESKPVLGQREIYYQTSKSFTALVQLKTVLEKPFFVELQRNESWF